MTVDDTTYSNPNYYRLVESIPVPVFIINKNWQIEYANKEAANYFGYDYKEFKGLSLWIIIPQFEDKVLSDSLLQPLTGTAVKKIKAVATGKNSLSLPVELALTTLDTEEQELFLVTIFDLSEKIKEFERFKIIFDAAPTTMILSNYQGEITLANTQAENLLGYQNPELISSKLENLIPARFKNYYTEQIESHFKDPLSNKPVQLHELYLRKKDGSEVPVEITIKRLETPSGKKILLSISDLTDRKLNETAITNYLRELENRNKEMEQLGFITSHDLQEPLRTVINYIQVLEEDHLEELSPVAAKHLQTISKASERMSKLIKSLMNFSLLGKGRQVEIVDLNDLISKVIADLDHLITRTGAQIRVEEMPQLIANETELWQLFQNLISNAIKFQKNGQTPEIEISFSLNKGKRQFVVKDNGIGIPEYHSEKIFQIFQRLHKHESYEGIGMGLAICKKIVQLHKGSIWVKSEPGNGSAFYFTL